MSVIIQAGHPSSYSSLLIEMLYDRGLKKAEDSNLQQLTSEQVSKNLYKINKKSKDIEHNKLADSISVDFLLANIDQDIWGWESPYNLPLLSYWEQFELQSKFILVFDHPKNMFFDLKKEDINLSFIDNIMQEWVRYNTQLIAFLEKNNGRCILVEGLAAASNIESIKKEIENIVGVGFLDSNLGSDFVEKKELDIEYKFIIDEIIIRYSKAVLLFNKLLEKSLISHSKSIGDSIDLSINDLLGIFKQQVFHQTTNSPSVEHFNTEYDDSLLKENILLREQIHSIQEDFESYFLKKNKSKSAEITSCKESICKAPVYYGAQKIIKDSFSYKLGSILVESGRSPRKITELPYFLFEEYKSYKSKEKSELENIPIEEYYDFYEAEIVKRHLSYKLGKTITDGFSSPYAFISLPISIGKEVLKFKND